MKTAGLILISILALLLLPIFVMYLELHNNFLDWNPKLDFITIGCFLLAVVSSAIVFIIRPRIAPEVFYTFILIYLPLALVLVVFGVFQQHELDPGFMGRDTQSPLWFKVFCSMLLLFPGFSLLYYFKKKA